jgi:hypothetical protein
MALKGLDYDALFPGRFIKAGDLKGKDVTLQIATVRIEALPQDKGGEKVKGIVSFAGAKKEWVLNRTNGECLKAMFGRDTGEWVGKHVTLYPAPVNGDIGIRVRGSTDLKEPIEFELKLARKAPRKVRMLATRVNGKAAPKPAPAPEPEETPEPEPTPESDAEEIVDPETGEVFPA